jgi:hypothetical protein
MIDREVILEPALLIGGLLHFALLAASFMVPKTLDWRRELQTLSPLSRHLIWVHALFIVLTLIGLGAITLVGRPELAAGGLLGRAFCGFVAGFWLIRLVIQLFVFDARPYLTKWWMVIGFHTLTVVFAYLTAAYGAAAVL